MFKIGTHIYKELKNSNIIISELESKERSDLLTKIRMKYINNTKKGIFMWEKFVDSIELNDCMGWSYIREFVGNNKCIMFFNQDEEKKMFIVLSGSDLLYILSETCGFEFYITNIDCDYLICFNHHNTLFGCGDAKKWIEKLLIKNNKNT